MQKVVVLIITYDYMAVGTNFRIVKLHPPNLRDTQTFIIDFNVSIPCMKINITAGVFRVPKCFCTRHFLLIFSAISNKKILWQISSCVPILFTK